MPKFRVTVEGATYRVEAADEQQAWDYAVYTHNNPESLTTDTGALRTVGDIGAGLVKGVGNLASTVGGLGSLLGITDPNNALERAGKGVSDFGQGLKSAGLQNREALLRQKVEAAGGEWEKAWEYIKTAGLDPGMLLSMTGEQLVNFLPMLGAARVAGAGAKALAAKRGLDTANTAKLATRAGTTAAVGTGAVQQGSSVGTDTYTEAYKKMVADGVPADQARERALGLARQAGMSGAAISALAQVLFGPWGLSIERALAGGAGASKRRLANVGMGLIKEQPSELTEELGGLAAKNALLQQVDPNRPITKDMGETAGQTVLTAGATGALIGGLQRPAEAATPTAAPAATAPAAPTTQAPPAPQPQPQAQAPAQPTPVAGPTPEEEAAEIAALVARGMDEEDAQLVVASRRPVPTAEAPAAPVEEEGPLGPEPPPPEPTTSTQPAPVRSQQETIERVKTLFEEYLGTGMEREAAGLKALEQAYAEARADAEAEAESAAPVPQPPRTADAQRPPAPTPANTPAADSGGARRAVPARRANDDVPTLPASDDVGGRDRARVDRQPSAVAAPTGAGESVPSGVVRTKSVPADNAQRKGQEPTAVARTANTVFDEVRTVNEQLKGMLDKRGRAPNANSPRRAKYDSLLERKDALMQEWDALDRAEKKAPAPTAPPQSATQPQEPEVEAQAENPALPNKKERDARRAAVGARLQQVIDDPARPASQKRRAADLLSTLDEPDFTTRVAAEVPNIEFLERETTALEGAPTPRKDTGKRPDTAMAAALTKAEGKQVEKDLKQVVEAKPTLPKGETVEVADEKRTGGAKPDAPKVEDTTTKGYVQAERVRRVRRTQKQEAAVAGAAQEAAERKQEADEGDSAFEVREQEKALRAATTDADREKALDALARLGQQGAPRSSEKARRIVSGELGPFRAVELAKKHVRKGEKVRFDEADAAAAALPSLETAKSGVEALNLLLNSRLLTPDQQAVATRLRPHLTTTRFVVLQKGDPVPPQLAGVKDWATSRGAFVGSTIYLRGASWGDQQGVNPVTFLHEALHAATVKKLEAGLKNPNSPSAPGAKAVVSAMEAARTAVDKARADGSLPPDVAGMLYTTRYLGLNDPTEFIAYGLTNPAFQNYLDSLPSGTGKKTLWDRFVDAMLKLFGVDAPAQRTVLDDLIDATNSVMDPGSAAATVGKTAADVLAENRALAAKRGAAFNKMVMSSAPDEMPGAAKAVLQTADPELRKRSLKAIAKTAGDTVAAGAVRVLPTDFIVEWAENLDVPGAREAWDMVDKAASLRLRTLMGAADISDDWAKLSPEQAQHLSAVIHVSTTEGFDPDKLGADPAKDSAGARDVRELWNKLNEPAKAVYRDARDYFKRNFELQYALLLQRIDDLQLDDKKRVAEMKKQVAEMYNEGRGLEPYFPLMRYGNYWISVKEKKTDGTKTKRAFYMFESRGERDQFEAQLRADGFDIATGDDPKQYKARSNMSEESSLLKGVLGGIDAAKKANETDLDDLRKMVYQLYIRSLPQADLRKSMQNRKNRAGYSMDALRNFANASTSMANNLSRLKYAHKIRMRLSSAKDTAADRPNYARIGTLITELEKRADYDMDPLNLSDTLRGINTASQYGTKLAFLYFMTSPKTALVQFASIPVFVLPAMSVDHGAGAVAKEFGRLFNVFNHFSMHRETRHGEELTLPNLTNSSAVKLNPDEKKAMKFAADRGLIEQGMLYEHMDRQDAPTQSGIGRKFDKAYQLTGALFSGVERINREATFLVSFRLHMKKPGATPEKAMQAALDETRRVLFDYRHQNRPRFMRHAVGRIPFQFKMFPLMSSAWVIRNAYRSIPRMAKNKAQAREARLKLAGMLGASYLMAGYLGIPFAQYAMTLAQWGAQAMRGDEEEEDPNDVARYHNYTAWVRDYVLPNAIDKALGEERILGMTPAQILDQGMLNWLTGTNLAGSLNMTNPFLPELKADIASPESLPELFFMLAGPLGSLGVQFTRAYGDYKSGDYLRAAESVAPAAVRGVITAGRLATEGAKDRTNTQLMSSDAFSTTDIVKQALGFQDAELARLQQSNFSTKQIEKGIMEQRQKLLTRWDNATDDDNEKRMAEVQADIDTFNARHPYPGIMIDAKTLQTSESRRDKARARATMGYRDESTKAPNPVEGLLRSAREGAANKILEAEEVEE